MVGDFNGDGKADLVITNEAVNSVSVLLGRGDGTFPMFPRYPTGNLPQSVAAGDFKGDGEVGLAKANAGDNSVSVLLGKGDGTLQTHVDYPTGSFPSSVAVGDFNGDGKTDLAVANMKDNSLIVLQGNGDGTFQTLLPCATGGGPCSVAVGDFNGDGKADLVVLNCFTYSVSVLLGSGNGIFQTHVDYETAWDPQSVSVGDFNGDGKADLVVANQSEPSVVSVLLGKGDGTFLTHVDYATGNSPSSVAVGDFNGDGKADLAVANNHPIGVSVLLSNGDGSFQMFVDYPTEVDSLGHLSTVAVNDFNGDGKLDLAVTAKDSSVSVLLGSGDGTFQPSMNYARGQSYGLLTIADFNRDGAPDIAFVTKASAVSILLNETRATSLELESSSNPSTFGQSVTFTSTVHAGLRGSGIGTPSGTVTFGDGTQQLDTESLSDSGVVSFSTSALSPGTHSITAAYSGDANFNPHTSVALSQVVVLAKDFAIGANPGSVSVKSGSSVDFDLTFTAANGFAGSVLLSCSVTPTPILAPTCALNPQSVSLALDSSATVKLTITTTGPSISLSRITARFASVVRVLVPDVRLGAARCRISTMEAE